MWCVYVMCVSECMIKIWAICRQLCYNFHRVCLRGTRSVGEEKEYCMFSARNFNTDGTHKHTHTHRIHQTVVCHIFWEGDENAQNVHMCFCWAPHKHHRHQHTPHTDTRTATSLQQQKQQQQQQQLLKIEFLFFLSATRKDFHLKTTAICMEPVNEWMRFLYFCVLLHASYVCVRASPVYVYTPICVMEGGRGGSGLRSGRPHSSASSTNGYWFPFRSAIFPSHITFFTCAFRVHFFVVYFIFNHLIFVKGGKEEKKKKKKKKTQGVKTRNCACTTGGPKENNWCWWSENMG